MQVRVGFFGVLRKKVKMAEAGRDFKIDIEPGCTLGDALNVCGIPLKDAKLMVVNGKKGTYSQMLSHNDRISVFPNVLKDI